MNIKALLWKVPLTLAGIITGTALLLLVAAGCVLYVPSLRQAVLNKALPVAEEKTGMDIDVGGIYLSPFHHSPLALYRAYKGKEDLPLEVNIDSLFVGHRTQDTLLYLHALRLKAQLLTTCRTDDSSLTAIPITVEHLMLDRTTFHSDTLIAAVGIDAIIGHLELNSPDLNIAQGRFPLHGLRLADASIGIGLRDTPPDTTAQDTTPTLMAFDVPDAEIRNLQFGLTPLGIVVHTDTLAVNVLADVGKSRFDVRRIYANGTTFSLGNLFLPFDELRGNACVDLERSLITSSGLHVRSDEIGAQANLSATEMNLESMRVDITGDADFHGSKARLRAQYDIDDEVYDAHVDVEKVDLSPFLKDSPPIVLAGEIDAKGKGLDIHSRAMRSKLKMHLTDAQYDNICASGMRLNAELADRTVEGSLHLPFAMNGDSLRLSALTDHRFSVAEFLTPERMRVNYQTEMQNVKAFVAGENYHANSLNLHFTTDTATTLAMATEGFTMDVKSPMHVMQLKDRIQPLLSAVGDSAAIASLTSLEDLTILDTLRRLIPELAADIALSHGSPVQHLIESKGLDINRIDLSLRSDTLQTALALDASIPEISHPDDSTALRLPAAQAAMRVKMTEGSTLASLAADSRLTDGAMSLHGLKTDADLKFDLERTGNDLNGTGRLQMNDLSLGEMELGSRTVNMALARSDVYPNALRADVQPDDIPMEIVDSILRMADIALNGSIRAQASVDGLPKQFDLSAEVLPIGVSALYKPYNVLLSLGETPIVMNHNHVDFNGLPIYGVDSTFIALTGGLDLNDMLLDVTLAADSFAPTKLVEGGPTPVYGDLATDIRGKVTGPLDSIMADVDVTILPTTDITYPIDKKNLAQVKPHGTVNVRYDVAKSEMNLGGKLNVDDGFVRYSPKMYPIMPFRVDSGSTVTFNGPLGQTMLDVSASQKVKADVQSEDEETRRVDFTTGVRVNSALDSIGLNAIGFFLEAPEDETITRELASVDNETREGLAATLLATGMYVGESNVAAQRGGYALSSIVNSRLNAAMANSKMGKIVDIDLSSAQTEHAGGKTNDLNIAISKSFFKDRLRITIGSSFTDNPEVNQASGLLSNLSAEYKLTKDGNVSLRAFAQRDYNNILEGDLYKSGLGVRAKQDWRRKELYHGDTISRTYGLIADADVAWRSNNSLGPNLTLTSSIRNLLGKGETFTVKGNGAYYWALRNRHPGDPKKTDTYKFGVNTSLVFPYLHWAGDINPDGDTRYMLGYQYENIAGGYGVHKVSGSFSYVIHNSEYVTHIFTPFSLSVVMMKAESDSLLNKAAEYPQLIKVIAGNEFVPSIGYNFIYNDYRSTRAVNTMLDIGIKESGNIINGIYCLFGHKWDEKDKKLGSITFNQFVKLNAELRNKFNFTDRICIATRLYAGANIPLGNSATAPLSEAFYAGGPNGMRAASPYAYGPGNFYSDKYNQNFFHAGDVKLEANFEFRFPIVWKIYGATFVDAGNVWTWYSTGELFKKAGITDYVEQMQLHGDLYDGIMDNPELAKQIALGTGLGLRLDYEGLVVRLDLGVGIHAPYQTYKYDKETWKPDKSQPINTYYNIPSVLDGLRLNFGIGYPF
ncbi:MAG: translocation/assembly module TamB domain-containing protein [Paludibacteraceae bacterium]|nr:translocation/assembly module TamB domain-containing protein [Paludibacteraceae bacterium]